MGGVEVDMIGPRSEERVWGSPIGILLPVPNESEITETINLSYLNRVRSLKEIGLGGRSGVM